MGPGRPANKLAFVVSFAMTELLEHAVDTARKLDPHQQDEIARIILAFAELPVIQLTPDEEAEIAAAQDEVRRGEIATHEQMQAIWTKHRR